MFKEVDRCKECELVKVNVECGSKKTTTYGKWKITKCVKLIAQILKIFIYLFS